MAEVSTTGNLTTVQNPASAGGLAVFTKMFKGLDGLPQRNKIALMAGIPLLIALVVSAFLWSKDASYKVLFSNVTDADGGAIIASLNQMNVPYRYSDSGNAIMVPMDKVHDTRLKLASQGLPKGSIVGFELLENQKLGITQFQEQINYQRALEGELARSIQSMGAVQTARVHLAIPKPSIFLREQQKPTASVVVALFGGRVLDKSQIQGIVHLVASSVPDLNPKAVSIVDQTGALLTNNDSSNALGSDATQLSYVHQIESSYTKRVMDILTPIFGAENVKATVTADVDFSQVESTEESYKPNTDPQQAAIRSQQTSESNNATGANPQGVPGTLSNQPPAAATAQIGGNPQTGLAGTSAANQANPTQSSLNKNSTINYEVDKAVKYTKAQVGAIKRVSAAVVVNNKSITSPKGDVKSVPLTPEETDQINALVREAIGFNKDRGDTVNVVNQAFNKTEEKALPIWQDPDMLDLAKSFGLPLGVAAATALLVFGLFKPMLKNRPNNVNEPSNGQLLSTSVGNDDAELLAQIAEEQRLALPAMSDPKEIRMMELRKMAKENPQLVANIVKGWVVGE